MDERKVVSASHPYYVMDDGTLWRGSIHGVGIGGVQWDRIPGPPADTVAKAELPDGYRISYAWLMTAPAIPAVRLHAPTDRNLRAKEARGLAYALLAAADAAERGT